MENAHQHTCQGVVVHCIDFRFREHLNRYLSDRFPDGYDLIAWAGGVKEIAEKGSESEIVGQIKLSHALHAPSLVCFIQHEDCGAYGGSVALGTGEREFQKNQLNAAKEAIEELLPGVKAETRFITLKGEVV